MRVFIVDDSKIVRERLAAMLSEIASIQVVGEAADGGSAIESIRDLEPDAVILDIHMPGPNGIQVLEKIKGSTNPPLVVMLTNFPYPQYRNKCLAAGADFFFDKSTEFEEVTQVLKKMIERPS